MVSRDFAEVQKFTHMIHQEMFEKMPLIPLWQLDSHVAYHQDLKLGTLDPLLIFTDVETWQLQKR